MKSLASSLTHTLPKWSVPILKIAVARVDIGKAAADLFFLLIGGLLLLPAGAFAQEYRAAISGTVVDPSGAVVPGATVVVRETQTGTITRTISDSVGQYAVPFLLPGDYSITVTKSGFETLVRGGITLQTQEHPIINLAMTVGSENRTVTVTAGAPLLDLADASIGDVIPIEDVADLPLNGRAPEMLAALAVGVEMSQAPRAVGAAPGDGGINSWVIGGTPTQMTETLLDGAPNETLSGSMVYGPSEDAVQEVSVRPFDIDASYGHTIGGTVNQVIKSGTNALHGTAYMFRQVADLDANLYFNDRQNPVPPTPPAISNLYGGTVGGPVWIPKIIDGRNKLFFFFAWERNPSLTPGDQILNVPTDAEKQGDFSALLAGGSNYQLYEPNTGTLNNGSFARTPVPNNCLTNKSSYCSTVANAGMTIDPIAANYIKLWPEPNITAGVSPITNENNYNGNANVESSYNNALGRLDYNASERDHVDFEMHHSIQGQTKIDFFNNNSTGSTLARDAYGMMIDNVFTVNPTTILDTRFNAMVYTESHTTAATQYTPASVGFPSNMQNLGYTIPLPTITTSGFNAPGYPTFTDGALSEDPADSYQAFADVVKLIGKHTVKVGLDVRQYRFRVFTDPAFGFTFGSNFVTCGTGCSAQPFGGDLAEFEYGLPESGSYSISPFGDYRAYYLAGFLQDDWRVSSHLTFNLGLRWDVDTPWGEKFGRTVNGFNTTAQNSASAAAMAAFSAPTVTQNDTTVTVSSVNTLGGLTFPSPDRGAPYQIQDKSGYWSPRLGFSYNPPRFNKTVVRGGFALFVQPQNLGNVSDFSNQEGYSAATSYAATTNSYFTNASTLDNPFPNGYVAPAGSSAGASTYLGESISFLAPVEHDEYSERWTLGVQHAVTPTTLVEVLYEGNHAVHLPINVNINATEKQFLTTNPYRDQNLASANSTSVANPFKGLLPLNSSYNGATTSMANLETPYPAFGSASVTEENETNGQSYFESGMVHIEQRARHGLTLTGNYEWAKMIEADTLLNNQDTKPERRISPNDHKQHFVLAGTYNLPFGRGKMFTMGGGRLADELIGGWVLNGIYEFQTGSPITFTGDLPFQSGMGVFNIRSSPRDTSTTVPALNGPSVFVTGSGTSCTVSASQPCDGSVFFNGQYSNHYRTLPTTFGWVRQDGFNNLDASMLKDFHIARDGKVYVQFRFETFNTLNHAIFGTPSLTATSKGFGYITSVYSNSSPRQVQWGLRLVF